MIALLLALVVPGWAADPWDGSLDRAWTEHPVLGDEVWQAEPRTTRAGLLRFADDATGRPEAVPFLVDRLVTGDDHPAVRRALADAIGRDLPAGGAWIAALLAREADPEVRIVLVSHMRRAEAAFAVPALRTGLSDPEPRVRAEAAMTAGMHADGHLLVPSLRTAARDEAPVVRANAIGVLGWLGDTASAAIAEALLADPDPLVRKRAQATLERVTR